MAQDWYLISGQPTFNGGFENQEFNDYVSDGLQELLGVDSPISIAVQIVKSDTTTITEIRAVVQNTTADTSTNSAIRQILTSIDTLTCGDYIKYKNKIWVITSYVDDNKIYEKGVMQLCNHTLLFQSPTGVILSYPCIDSNSTGSEDETKVITLGSTEKTITLPCDENTILLRNGRRFFIDKYTVEPKSYEITAVDTTSKNYGTKGLILLTVKECVGQDTDRIDLGICNYFVPTPEPEPIPVDTTYSTIACSNPLNTLTIGRSGRTLTPTFYNDGVVVTDVVAVWTYEYPVGLQSQYTIVPIVGTNNVKISVADNEDVLGEVITATVSNGAGGYVSSIELMAVSG